MLIGRPWDQGMENESYACRLLEPWRPQRMVEAAA